jgi:hypothetical protein
MARAHYKTAVRGTSGRSIANARVFVYETGTSTPVADLYTAASGGTAQASLVSNTQGEVEFWLDTPRNVALETTDNSDLAYYVVESTVTELTESAALALHMADEDAHLVTREREWVWSHSGTLVVATGALWLPVRNDTTLTTAIGNLTTLPTGADVIVDIILHPPGGGTASIFDTENRPTWVDGETDPWGEWTPDTTLIAAGSSLSFNYTQIGSTVAGANLTMTLYGYAA